MITFYVGEQPSDALVVTVHNSDGSVRNLTGVTSVDFIGDPLPAGTPSIANAAQGKVQYDFDAPFLTAANLTLQIQMEEGADTDLSEPFTISVQDPADSITPIVTPAQVEAWTGTSVSNGDVVRAQGIISLVVGRNLNDAVWYAGLSPNDQFWLQQGVGWQASEHPEGTAVDVSLPYIPGATSISNGDISIGYSEGSTDDYAELAANAKLALKRLSWLRPVRTYSAQPFLMDRYQPSTWTIIGRSYL